MQLFNNKVNGSIAYYRRTTSDMLMRVQLPASAGITNSGGNADNNSMWANVGSMYNQGFEFDINVTLVKKDFEWNMNYNLTTNMNKVTALDASVDAKRDRYHQYTSGSDHEERSGFGYLFYG